MAQGSGPVMRGAVAFLAGSRLMSSSGVSVRHADGVADGGWWSPTYRSTALKLAVGSVAFWSALRGARGLFRNATVAAWRRDDARGCQCRIGVSRVLRLQNSQARVGISLNVNTDSGEGEH